VIAFKAGGALDYVVPGKTGEFLANKRLESLSKVLSKFSTSDYNENTLRRSPKLSHPNRSRTICENSIDKTIKSSSQPKIALIATAVSCQLDI